ncbi:MAG: DNA-3-methyladenine glycosylase [Nocardioidaceae bacterium]
MTVDSDPLSVLGRPAPEAAPAVLGWRLTHRTPDGAVTVELSEVEAYAGESDPASHAGRGPTPRNAIMYGPYGRLYVYFSYGMHWCANLVVGPEGTAAAVLLRAGRVVGGVELARSRRGDRVADRALARGPACLTQALGIGREHNGVDLLSDRAFALDPAPPPSAVASGPRVGIRQAADVPWRFWLRDDRSVSAYRRSPRAPTDLR